MTQMNNYVGFYNKQQHELQAPTSYAAQKLYAERYGVPAKKQYMITVILADKPVSTAAL